MVKYTHAGKNKGRTQSSAQCIHVHQNEGAVGTGAIYKAWECPNWLEIRWVKLKLNRKINKLSGVWHMLGTLTLRDTQLLNSRPQICIANLINQGRSGRAGRGMRRAMGLVYVLSLTWTSATLQRPFLLGWREMTLPTDHWDLGSWGSSIRTTVLGCRLGWPVRHFCLDWREGR